MGDESLDPLVVRWWPLVYVVGLTIIGILWATGETRSPVDPQPPAYLLLLIGAGLLLVGTLWPLLRPVFFAGVSCAMFGLFFRAFSLALYQGTFGQRLLGPTIYMLVAVGLAFATLFSPRVHA